jgi:pyrroloquinoline quinone biosynthesis protein D
VWSLCDGSRSVAAIAAVIAAEFDADEAVIRRDVGAFVDDLRAARLITLTGA